MIDVTIADLLTCIANDSTSLQITPEQGQFMAMLARLVGAKTYLEVGVFTGHVPFGTAGYVIFWVPTRALFDQHSSHTDYA